MKVSSTKLIAISLRGKYNKTGVDLPDEEMKGKPLRLDDKANIQLNFLKAESLWDLFVLIEFRSADIGLDPNILS